MAAWRRSALDDLPIGTTGVLALFLGGSDDSFTGDLLALIAKADPGNKARLAEAFPDQVKAYDTWMDCPHIPTWAELREAIAARP